MNPIADTRAPAHDDTGARHEIRRRLDATLFVEAGAGTGKTTALVGRIVELVATGAAPLRAIAAITFTEAAAGELRDRVREQLERLAAGEHDDEYADPALDGAGRDRRRALAAEALADVDGAAISTLHGFARRILAEHPFEAGLPPAFEVFDELRSSVAFDDRWEAFVDLLLDDPDHTLALQRALVTGVSLDHLRDVALELNRNWDLVADAELPPPAPVDVSADAVLAPLTEADRATRWCAEVDDLLLAHVTRLADYRHRLASAEGELEVLQLLEEAPTIRCRRGRAASWDGHKDEVVELLAAAADARERIHTAVAQAALAHLLRALRDLTVEAADTRRRDGTLEFHDLLVQARDLVRRRADVSSELHETYRYLLIDEFQDTDPIQAELAFRIATDDPDPTAHHWTQLHVPPGRLFFVGDAKQAIYRFRRADIGLFLEVESGLVDEPLRLTRNRRSVPGVIDWVNAVFGRLIGDGVPGVQPAYDPLVAHRPPHRIGPVGALGAPPAAPVVLLGGPVADRSMAEVRSAEAADIAEAVRRVRDERWPVGDDAGPARLADVCILIPTRTSLPALEDALETAGLPYRVESSSLVYASPEVRDLLTTLRAVDDPTDEVSIVGALRSPMFGCGDDDLAQHRVVGGGAWDYRGPAPESLPSDHPVSSAMASLRSLHEQRWWHDASGLIERVLAERRVFELALDARRPRDVWRRLRFVADQARMFTDAYGSDLRRYLAWADLQAADDVRVVEAILPESDDDAVRIMTVHASKGLEFPVVVLGGLNVEDRRRGGVEVLWHGSTPEVSLFKGTATPGYEQLAIEEQTMEAYEQLRLLYVAATRARDHLVVSLHHKADATANHAARLAALVDAEPGLSRRLEPADASGPPPEPIEPPEPAEPAEMAGPVELTLPFDEPPAPAPTDDLGHVRLLHDDLDARQRWIDRWHERFGPDVGPRTLAATTIAKLGRPAEAGTGAEEVDLEQPPWRRGRAGTAVGRAVHAVLQVADLRRPDDVAGLAHAQAVAEGVPERAAEIERLARTALGAPTVTAAVRSGRYWRELYVGAPVGDRVLEGFVDLLVDGPQGLTVVDYKTDAVADEAAVTAAVARYRLQGAAYAVAVEEALGRPVERCVFLFVRGEGADEREITDLAAATNEVRALLGG